MSRKLLGALAVGAAMLVTLVVVLVVRASQGDAGWTGILVRVPYCPADAGGCRVVASAAGFDVTDSAVFTQPGIPYADWSGGATTVEIRVGAGSYSVGAEGCRGYSIAPAQVTVRQDFHTVLDYAPGGYWNLPGFVGRTCPGFAFSP